MGDNAVMRILLVEDDAGDALLVEEMLSQAKEKTELLKCERLSEATALLDGVDIALLDLGLPDSRGLETLGTICGINSDLPVIVLTGLMDEEAGVEAIKEGAQDYLVKGRINGVLLSKAIRYAIERKKIENERRRLITELREAAARVKLLSGLLPICANCKKIRDDRGYWQQIESYISSHSEAAFSHGLCPECAKKLYPEFYNK